MKQIHLHSCIISFNRPELTKQCLESYQETVELPHSLVIVDNGSEKETLDWLGELEVQVVLLGENRYPGYACNRGWELMPPQTTLLHRADNDFAFLPNWCQHVLEKFARREVGQVGLRTNNEELFAQYNVGGNNVIRRELWDQGLRYDERPWTEYPPGFSEDSYFSPAIEKLGYRWGRVKYPCIQSLASGDWNDPYYQKSHADRRIPRPAGA